MRWAFDVVTAVSMGRGDHRPLAHPVFMGWRIVIRRSAVTFLVCNWAANALIRNWRLYARFAKKMSRINWLLQTTNLGVRSSNLFGRATKSMT